MESIVITPKSKEEAKAINEVLLKMNIASKRFSDDDLEDMGLLAMMKEVDLDDKVSEEEIRNLLNGK